MENILLIKCNNKINLDFINHIGDNPYLIYGNNSDIKKVVERFNNDIISKEYINISNKKLFNLFDYTNTKARIEPGAIIRENVSLADDCIILMGAVVNINSTIGSRTMVDMNAVIGSGAIIKNNCHIGAGSVISGMLEPISNKPVIINNNVFIGANCVILEGVTIGENSVIGAGCIVTKDVNPNSIVYEKKEYVIKEMNNITKEKTLINEELRE